MIWQKYGFMGVSLEFWRWCDVRAQSGGAGSLSADEALWLDSMDTSGVDWLLIMDLCVFSTTDLAHQVGDLSSDLAHQVGGISLSRRHCLAPPWLGARSPGGLGAWEVPVCGRGHNTHSARGQILTSPAFSSLTAFAPTFRSGL